MIRAGILCLICLGVGCMINLFSPTAALSMDPDERLEFWIFLCLIGGLGIFTCQIAFTFLDVQWPKILKAFVQTIAGTTAVLIPLFSLYDPSELPETGTTTIFVWAIMVLIVAGTIAFKPKTAQSPVAPSPDVLEPPKILTRLPVHLQQSELYALSAEDHYVRVHTKKGDDIILMRLSDAIAETGHVEGLQIHRSWWVAKAAIDDIKPKGRAAEITLRSGGIAPVSRSGFKTIKDMGWY